MRPGLLVSGRPSLPLVSVHRFDDTRPVRATTLGLWLQKVACDVLGDHVSTCTDHSGAKKAHDWVVKQLADLLRTTHSVKTQQLVKSQGQ